MRERELDVFHLEQALVLLDERVLRLGQDLHERCLIKIFQRRDNRQTADEFGDKAELQQIFRLNVAQHLAGAAFIGADDVRAEADRRALATPR
jgi:hypothetical protein